MGGGERGTHYKISYRDVLPTWIAKSISHDPLFCAKFGIWIGQFFEIMDQTWLKFKKI